MAPGLAKGCIREELCFAQPAKRAGEVGRSLASVPWRLNSRLKLRIFTYSALFLLFWSGHSFAKRYGGSSPGGRTIYQADERFEEALDHKRRNFMIETALGLGPEGHLGVLFGYKNYPVEGLAFFLGYGAEFNPARQYTASFRYELSLFGLLPYASLGYLLKDLPSLKTHNHNIFGEIGLGLEARPNYYVHAAVGLRYIAGVHARSGSILSAAEVDEALLNQELKELERWVPTFVLRFSRAF